ncbi:calcium-binding protein [Thalassorhabdomicrobium marinisediminis]|uniref:calcium-binding protein n=1 Tax=Thalassorhabdomicrobium marinisediminis TaxID=2170577 RepID=UPI0024905B1D|nr:calcium-binding protein [Thalassorhabdomicrobium marinisediminis]
MIYFKTYEVVDFRPVEDASDITDLDVCWVDGVARLVVTTRAGGLDVLAFGTSLDTVSSLDIPDGGAGTAPLLAALDIDGQTVVGYYGPAGSGLQGFEISASGEMDSGSLFEAPPGETFSAVQSVRLGSETVIVTAAADTGSLTCWSVSASGQMIALGAAPLRDTGDGTVNAMAALDVGGRSFVLTVDAQHNALSSFEVMTGAALQRVDTLDALSGNLPIADPTALVVAQVAGVDFALLASASSNSITVVTVSEAGVLAVADHVIDGRNTRFEGITALDAVTVGDQVFVIAGGADDGISLLMLLPTGRLLHLETIADSLTTTLNNVSAITATSVDGKLEIVVASQSERGVTRFTIDPGEIGTTQVAAPAGEVLYGDGTNEVLVGQGGDDSLTGRAGADILIDGAGSDRLRGGQGADTFVFVADGEVDYVEDFNIAEDRLDLTAFTYLRNMDQLTLETMSKGIRVIYGDETVIVRSHDGNPIDTAQFRALSAVELSHVSVGPRVHDISGDGSDNRLEGSGLRDILRGEGGDDTLLGQGGDDILFGGTGADTLEGGAGADSLSGEAGNDILRGEAGGDTLLGGAGHDRLSGGSGDDHLIGGTGRDTLWDGAGEDSLTGGDGADVFVLGQDGARDTITDFDPGEDRLDLFAYGLTDLSQIDISTLIGGALLTIAGESLRLFTASGAAVTREMLEQGGWVVGITPPPSREITGTWNSDTLTGSDFADTITGLGGFDTITGGGGDDLLYGGNGRDTLSGGAGDDRIEAGSWSDSLSGGEGRDTLYGQAGDDVIDGGAGDDVLFGGDGRDILRGDAGNDRLNGDWWADTLFGGAGTDTLNGGQGNDDLRGGLDNDTLNGQHGNDRIYGGDGADHLDGGIGRDFMYGGAGADVLLAGTWSDVLYGGMGDDLLDGGAGDEQMWGDAGNDSMSGGTGRDRMYGGDGADTMDGGTWSDQLWGDAGDDLLHGNDGNDVLDGGAGDDTLEGENGADRLYGGAGDDVLRGGLERDRLEGGDGNDRLAGNEWSDLLFGGAGDDFLWGGHGNDGLSGGLGDDWLYGGDGQDKLYGSGGDDALFGGTWSDELAGGFGNDTLDGGAGSDLLIGGGGADVFIFNQGGDVIRDFSKQDDSLMIDVAVLRGAPATRATLTDLASVQDGNLVISFGGFDSLTLEGLTSLSGVGISFDGV